MAVIRHKRYGSVEGILTEYEAQPDSQWFACKIQDRITSEIYTGIFHHSLLVDIKEVFRKRVLAKGNLISLNPISIQIESIKIVSDDNNLSYEEMVLLGKQLYYKLGDLDANNFD